MLLSPISKQKGGENMFELLLTFFISVLSGIVANYVIKWLERKNDHSNDSKND